MSPKLAVLTASAAAILTTTAVLACDVHSGQPEHLHAAASSSDDPARIDISSSPMPGEPSLAEIRRATEKYRDIQVALAEGYIRDPSNMCEMAEMMGEPKELGAMGVHYFRPDLLGITAPPNPRVDGASTHTDFLNPAILIYEPQADGSQELIAVENLVFVKSGKEAGHDAPPSFHGVAYDTMRDDPATALDEAHMFEPHHDRHVWLYRENPNGVFAPYNPRVTCEHHAAATPHKHASASGR